MTKFETETESSIFKVKQLGNQHFKTKNYVKAIEHYLLACEHASTDERFKFAHSKLLTKVALCHK